MYRPTKQCISQTCRWYWASRIPRAAYTNFRVYVCRTNPPKPLDRFA